MSDQARKKAIIKIFFVTFLLTFEISKIREKMVHDVASRGANLSISQLFQYTTYENDKTHR